MEWPMKWSEIMNLLDGYTLAELKKVRDDLIMFGNLLHGQRFLLETNINMRIQILSRIGV